MSKGRTLACAVMISLSSALGAAVRADAPVAKAASLPKGLAVPAGQRRAFQWKAQGVQIYTCQADAGAAAAWVFTAPEAKLRDAQGRDAGTHFAGPTWQALDQSRVVGKKLVAASPDPTSIPWLLLQAESHEGNGVMAAVTYIQRLDTKGGLAPATGCDASHLGETARVDYSASYAFYVSESARAK
jgi:Protein of unknown function (DUF3455)